MAGFGRLRVPRIGSPRFQVQDSLTRTELSEGLEVYRELLGKDNKLVSQTQVGEPIERLRKWFALRNHNWCESAHVVR